MQNTHPTLFAEKKYYKNTENTVLYIKCKSMCLSDEAGEWQAVHFSHVELLFPHFLSFNVFIHTTPVNLLNKKSF